VITLVRHTVHQARRVLYFPLDFLAQIHAPLSLQLLLGRFSVNIDAPLREYLVRGSK